MTLPADILVPSLTLSGGLSLYLTSYLSCIVITNILWLGPEKGLRAPSGVGYQVIMFLMRVQHKPVHQLYNLLYLY